MEFQYFAPFHSVRSVEISLFLPIRNIYHILKIYQTFHNTHGHNVYDVLNLKLSTNYIDHFDTKNLLFRCRIFVVAHLNKKRKQHIAMENCFRSDLVVIVHLIALFGHHLHWSFLLSLSLSPHTLLLQLSKYHKSITSDTSQKEKKRTKIKTESKREVGKVEKKDRLKRREKSPRSKTRKKL